jgi:hypothetical protein
VTGRFGARRIAVAATALLALASCGSSASGETGGGSATTTAPAAGAATAGVPEILDVVAPAVGGGEVDLRAYAGRPLVLWFWAPG